MTSHHQTHTIFKSSLMQVLDYRCDGMQPNQEELPAQHEIVLPRAGAFLRRDAMGTVLADPNQVLFFNQHQPYEICHPLVSGDRSTVFILEPALLLELIGTLDPSVESRVDQPFLRSEVAVNTQLHALYYLEWDSPAQDALQVEEQVIMLLSQVLRVACSPSGASKRRRSPDTLRSHTDLVQQVMLLLNQNYREHLHLDQIAAMVNVSPYHLCRIFKQVTGISIHQYRTRLRLSNAIEGLDQASYHRLDQLALDFGFSHHSHFSTAFRQAFGFRPSDLRKMRKILQA